MDNSKIIFAEDYIEMRNLLVALLKKQYNNILLADNGKEVLELLKQHNDVVMILTDIEMPEMNGFDLVKHIRTKLQKPQSEIPIIAFTSGSTIPRDEYLKAGFNDLIIKTHSATPIFEAFDDYCNRKNENNLEKK